MEPLHELLLFVAAFIVMTGLAALLGLRVMRWIGAQHEARRRALEAIGFDPVDDPSMTARLSRVTGAIVHGLRRSRLGDAVWTCDVGSANDTWRSVVVIQASRLSLPRFLLGPVGVGHAAAAEARPTGVIPLMRDHHLQTLLAPRDPGEPLPVTQHLLFAPNLLRVLAVVSTDRVRGWLASHPEAVVSGEGDLLMVWPELGEPVDQVEPRLRDARAVANLFEDAAAAAGVGTIYESRK